MPTVGNVIFKISADLQSIQGQLRTLEGSFQGSFNRISARATQVGRNLLGAFGVGLGVGGLVAFGKSVVDLADKITDLADQTGLSVAVLGGVRPILEQNNSSVEQFAKGIQFAQKSLGDITGTGKEAAEALTALGLNVKELQNATPDQFLEKFVAALGKVENQNDRAAIAFKVLGRAGVELIPTILNLAENGIPKLSREVEEAYKSLGRIADQVVVLTAKLVDLAAVPIADFFRFFGIGATAADALRAELAKVNAEIENIDKLLARNRSASDFTFGLLNSPETRQQRRGAEEQTLLQRRSDAISKLIDLNDKLIRSEQKAKPGDFKNLAAGAEKANQSINSFIEGLHKQGDAMRISIVELTQGSLAAKALGLDLEFAAVKAKLLADGKVVPPDIEGKFQKAKEEILGFAQALARAKLDADLLKQSLEEMDKAFPEPLMPGEMIDKLPAGLKAGAGGIINEDDFEKIKELQKRWDELQTSLALGSFDTSTPQGKENQRITQIYVDFKNTADKIEETGRELGLSQEEIANATAQAWENALNKINDQADETTKFWERAIERIQDSVAGGIEDILSGNIKSWQEWGNNIKKVIDQLVSQFLAAQLNAAVFGPQTGGSGGGSQMGGLLGGLLGGLFGGGGGFGGRPAGVEGPLMEGGGFFSNIWGWLASLFHQGGTIGETGHPGRAVSPRLFVTAPRYHQGGIVGDGGRPLRLAPAATFAHARRYQRGTDFLLPNEVPIIAHVGERIIPAGQSAGMRGVYNFTFNGVQDMDSFRRSRPQLLADLTRAVERGKKHL